MSEQLRMTEQSLNRLQKIFLERAASAHRSTAPGRPGSGDLQIAKIWFEAADLVQEEKRRVFGAPEVAA